MWSRHEFPFLRLGVDLLFDNNKCIISQSIYRLGFYSIITCMGCCLECFCIKYLNDTLSNIKTNNKYVQKAFKNILWCTLMPRIIPWLRMILLLQYICIEIYLTWEIFFNIRQRKTHFTLSNLLNAHKM